MKHLKTIAVAAVAATALMAIVASTASATALTSGTTVLPKGTSIHAVLKEGEAVLKSSFIGEVKCKESTVAGSTENEGSSSETVKGAISKLTFTNCNGTVTVIKNGSLEVHTDANDSTGTSGNGTLTSNGAEVTIELAGLHCIFSTSNTDVGTIDGSMGEEHAVLTAASQAIPRTGGRSGAFCGSSATWTATYTIDEVVYNGTPYTSLTIH